MAVPSPPRLSSPWVENQHPPPPRTLFATSVETNRGRLGHLGPLLRPSKRLLAAAAAAGVDHLHDSLLRRLLLGNPVPLQGVVCDEQVFSVQAGRTRKHKRWAAQPSWAVVGDCCRGGARHRGNASEEEDQAGRTEKKPEQPRPSRNNLEPKWLRVEGPRSKSKVCFEVEAPTKNQHCNVSNNSGTISKYLPDDPTLPWVLNVGLGKP